MSIIDCAIAPMHHPIGPDLWTTSSAHVDSIRYAPGSHVGILYQSRVEEVNKTLLAFADGDKEKAKELGETEVDLNDNWKSALRQRQEFHHTTRSDDSDLPTRLKLKKFLEFGELRPATRRMLELAHNASKSKDIQKILNEDLQAALTFSDIVTILMRDGVDLLKNGEENAKRRESLYVVNAEIDAIEQNMRKVRGIGRRTLTSKDRKMIFKGTDLTEDEQEKLNIRSGSADAVRAKVKDVKKVVPKLCELIEPAKFRYYSVASSPDVHPNEIHIFSHHLKYETKSAVSQTSPLLADTEPKVHRRGAASDYIVSKSLPRYFLAIEAIAEVRYARNLLEGLPLAHSNLTLVSAPSDGGHGSDRQLCKEGTAREIPSQQREEAAASRPCASYR